MCLLKNVNKLVYKIGEFFILSAFQERNTAFRAYAQISALFYATIYLQKKERWRFPWTMNNYILLTLQRIEYITLNYF